MITGYRTAGGTLHPVHVKRESTLIVGKGKGKDELLIQLFLRDARAQRPCVFIDANGSLTDSMLPFISDAIVIDPTFPFSLNVLHNVPPEQHASFSSLLLEIIRGPSDVQTTRIDKYVRAGLQALLTIPDTDLISLYFLLKDDDYLKKTIEHLADPFVKDIWEDFTQLKGKEKRDNIESTIGRLLYFVLDPRIRQSIGQRTCKLSFTRPVIVTLKESELGAENVSLIGSLIMARMVLADTGTLYVTEAHRFPVLGTVLTTIPTFLAVQSLSLFGKRREALLGAIQKTIAFRTSVRDAELLAQEFTIPPGAVQLTELADYAAYVMQGMTPVQFQVTPHTFPPDTQSVTGYDRD
jgi:hypothetical protein